MIWVFLKPKFYSLNKKKAPNSNGYFFEFSIDFKNFKKAEEFEIDLNRVTIKFNSPYTEIKNEDLASDFSNQIIFDSRKTVFELK